MHRLGKRVWFLVALGLMAVPVTAAGIAYACTALATISTNTASATVGTTVTISGKGFAPHDPTDIRTTPAEVHFDSASAPALASVSPSSGSTGGTFSVDIAVPAVDPGEHVLIVTQNGIDGRPAYGTPARAVLTVNAAPIAAATTPPLVADIVAAPPVGNMPVAPTRRPTMAQRMASCRAKYNVSKAKTKLGKKRVAARRASCMRAARNTA